MSLQTRLYFFFPEILEDSWIPDVVALTYLKKQQKKVKPEECNVI